MSTSESWFLEYPTSGDSFSCKIWMYLCPPPPAQFRALVNVKPARLSHSTLGSEQSQAWEKNVHDTFTSAILRDTSFSWCIVRKYISGNWPFIFISITFMLQKRLIFIRRGGEVRFEAGAPRKILPLHPLSPPDSATVVINLYFTSAFILYLLFVIFGEGSSLLAHLETYFIAEEKGTIQVFILY